MRSPLVVFLVAFLGAGCTARPTTEAPNAPAAQMGAPSAVALTSVADKRAAFAQAYDTFRHGDAARALPIFRALVTSYPELADYDLYFIGVIDIRLQQEEAAEAALGQLIRDYPSSVKALPGTLELGKLLLNQDRVDQARPLLQSAAAAADSSIAQNARLGLAEIDERNGAYARAYAEFMQLRHDAIGSAAARSAKEHALTLRQQHPELMPAGLERLEEARLLLREHDDSAALQVADSLLRCADCSLSRAERSEAALVMAQAAQGLERTDEALRLLRDVVDRFPATDSARQALFRYATILWNQDRDDAALQAFAEFTTRYAHQPKADEALYAIGRIHQSAGRSDAAIRSFNELARTYPQSALAAEGRWRIGWLHYLARDWSAAADSFGRAAARAPSARHRSEAIYWQARALEHGSDRGAARELYAQIIEREPTDYYAMWAEHRVRGSAALTTAAVAGAIDPPPTVGDPATPATVGPTDSFHLDRWRELRAAGVYGLGRGELAAIERLHRDDPGMLRFLLRAYPTVDGFAPALRLLRRSGGATDLSDDQRERLLYPLAFWHSVSREARASALDPLLVEAVMRQESLFDPEVRSPANAWGLLQLLPETAKRVAHANGIDAPLDLTQPDLNVQLGTRYLTDLLARFNGDLLKAIAAYNGGENAVEKWERRFAGLEPDEFVESISFRETRDYVKRVISNYRTYQQLYVENRAPAAGY